LLAGWLAAADADGGHVPRGVAERESHLASAPHTFATEKSVAHRAALVELCAVLMWPDASAAFDGSLLRSTDSSWE
jgi:hypothetical protein